MSDLQQLSQQVGDVSTLEERGKRAKADLDSLNTQREQAQRQAQEAQNLLSQAQRDAQNRFDQDMFSKQGQLRSLMDRVKVLEDRVKELEPEVVAKEGQLRIASQAMEDMKRKLAS